MAAATTSHQTKAVVRSSPSARMTDSSTSRRDWLRCWSAALLLGLVKSSSPDDSERTDEADLLLLERRGAGRGDMVGEGRCRGRVCGGGGGNSVQAECLSPGAEVFRELQRGETGSREWGGGSSGSSASRPLSDSGELRRARRER